MKNQNNLISSIDQFGHFLSDFISITITNDQFFPFSLCIHQSVYLFFSYFFGQSIAKERKKKTNHKKGAKKLDYLCHQIKLIRYSSGSFAFYSINSISAEMINC